MTPKLENFLIGDDEIVQLMHEAYHPVEKIAEWANLPVQYLERMYLNYQFDNGKMLYPQ